ncbi:MAG: GNAT family N-acetyltransferase [Pseudonocardiales bacterium]
MTLVIERPTAPMKVGRLLPCDVDDLLAMYARCSPVTTYHRWHGHLRSFPAAYLSAMVTGNDEHIAVVARHDDEVIGFASAAEIAPHTRELGVLVEDRWQRHGVGGQLLSRQLADCVALGTRFIRAEVLSVDEWLIDVMRRLGPTTIRPGAGILTARVRIRA